MKTRLAVVALLSLPAALAAQPPADASVCDGSEMRRIEQRRPFGGILAGSALLADVVVILKQANGDRQVERGMRPIQFSMWTLPVLLVGAGMAESHPSESFWNRVLARAKVGTTTPAAVRTCLHAPSATSRTDTEERWTYYRRQPPMWGSGGPLRTVSFTFREGVLAEVRRDDVEVPPGRVAAAGLPLPIPIDTTVSPPR